MLAVAHVFEARAMLSNTGDDFIVMVRDKRQVYDLWKRMGERAVSDQ